MNTELWIAIGFLLVSLLLCLRLWLNYKAGQYHPSGLLVGCILFFLLAATVLPLFGKH